MAIEHYFYIDSPVSQHELRDTLVRAGIGFEPAPDFEHTSNANSDATNVTLLVYDTRKYTARPDNGVWPTHYVVFRRRNPMPEAGAEWDFQIETVRGIVALLRAFPDADAYWEAYDARRPVLLRRDGRLVLAKALTERTQFWEVGDPRRLAAVDLPYTMEPLGPWEDVPMENK